MKSIAAFLAINVFAVAISVVAAGVMWLVGKALLATIPNAQDMTWPWVVAGLAGVATSVAFAAWCLKITSHLYRRHATSQARDPV